MRIVICMLVAAGAVAMAADPAPLAEIAKKLPQKLAGKPVAFVPLVANAPAKLNGDLSDPAWKNATEISLSDNHTGEAAKFKSTAKIFCTKDAFYIGVQFADPDPEHPKLDGAIWERDGFEFFIYPGEEPKQKLYYQAIVDSAGQNQHFYTHIYPKHASRALQGQWTPSLQSATAKGKDGWTGELRISFDDLSLSKEVETKKTPWRMAIYRNRPARGEEKQQSYGWAPTLNDSYHSAWRFGYIVPEPYASEELISDLIARQEKIAAATATEILAADGQAEVKILVEKLGNDAYPERLGAHEKLAALIKKNRGYELFIEECLRTAERQSDDAEVRNRSRKLLAAIRDARNPDEDPPPEGYAVPQVIQLDND
jgi:hypothetical protein